MLVSSKELLLTAKQKHFAIPSANFVDEISAKAHIEVAEEMNLPLILSFAQVHSKYQSLEEAANIGKYYANKAKVPVVLHLDHGEDFDFIKRAIDLGFTSVMIDASLKSFEDNIAITKKVIEVAHPLNVSVEAELGTIGTTGNGESEGTSKIIYTRPEDVKEFLERTGVDTLAIAIGTSHGIYPKDMTPKLRIDILQEIKKLVDIPLVLHGGSANPDEEISAAVKNGISKINISSDIKEAFYRKCRDVLNDPVIREPNAIYPPCIEAMKKVIYQKIDLFNDADKAKLYK